MPQLDVSEVLTDIDFYEGDLWCLRQPQIVGSNGLAVNTQIQIPFGGVVTQAKGVDLKRGADGEAITGSIKINTRFRLLDGKSGFTADIILRQTRQYTVSNVKNYSRFGAGFVTAICDLLPLAGSYPVAPGHPPVDNLG